MRSDSDLHEPRTNGEQSETGDVSRVSYESPTTDDDLYFIQAASGPIKIGRGKDPRKRLTQCRIGSHEKLELIGSLTGRGYEERVWHTAFQDFRLRGEWFALNDDLDEAITLAIDGKDWWHHLMPPDCVDLSEDPDEYEDDIVDWHIAICMALATLRSGHKPPLKDADELVIHGQDMVVRFLDAAARRSWAESDLPNPNHPRTSDEL